MNMREMFVQTTNELISKDPKVALVLGGISVESFRQSIDKYPNRVFDAGIMEQADISISAGLAITGMIPFFHTIAPFLAERAYEQLKIDFGYQKLGGNFVSNGASIDYSSFGATHQCPAEMNILKQIPNMQILVPGTPNELKSLILQTYNNGLPTYTRLSRDTNNNSYDVQVGKAVSIRIGSKATILVVGPMLQFVLDAIGELDVTILYYTSISPFDRETLRANVNGRDIIICEPYYEGALDYEVINAIDEPIKIHHIGIPHDFCKHYGTTIENYETMGLSIDKIRERISSILDSRSYND